MKPVTALTVAALAAVSLALLGCGDSGSAPQPTAAPPAWLLASAPGGDQPVAAAKAVAQEGDAVVVRGRIGGRYDPISDASPVFVIMDLAIQHCDQLHPGACPTPWDYCCEPPDNVTANSATVQVVDADGRPVDTELSTAGLKPLDEVVVVGTVGPRPTEDVLTVRVTGVYRAGG